MPLNNVVLAGTWTFDAGKGVVWSLDLSKIHPTRIEHFLTKGKSMFDDCHANATLEAAGGDKEKQAELARAMLGKFTQALYDGTSRIRGQGRPVTADPVEKEAFRLARIAIHADAKRLGEAWYVAAARKLELPFTEKTDKERQAIRDEAIKRKAATESVIEEAKANVLAAEQAAKEAEKALETGEIDLGF